MWGNPMRERERFIIQLQESTYQQQNNISSQGKYLTICPTEICLVFHAKTVPLSCLFHTSFSVPTVHCTDCSVRPKKVTQKSENRLKNRAKNCLDFHAKSVRLYRSGSVQYRPPTAEKNFGQKSQKKFSRESCPLSSKNVPSLLLTFLSQACSENLSNSPPNVLSRHSTCLAHYPMHSFII
jgi:hypothetical protein